MTTRGYCAATTAAPVTAVASGTWTYASEEVQRAWLLAVDTAQTLANGTSIGPWTAGNTASDRRFVSPPLNGAQTIAGTLKAYARAAETLALGNITTQMEVYVVSNDGQTVRGTLLSIGHYGSGAELNLTTKRNVAFALAGTTLSSVNAQDRDRIVVVFGYTDSGGLTPEAQATWGSSQANAIDFPEDETTTTSRNPWFEFSQDLVFDLSPTWIGDPHQASTVTLNGSDVSSLAKFDGSLSATFDQATANLQPTSQAGFSRTQMDFDDTFGSKDFLATATTLPSFLPNRGHWTIIVEFASDNQGAAGGANGRIGPVGASASGCLWCNIYPGTGAALRLSAGMLDTSFASHQANDTVDVATGVRVVGTFAGRGQMISTQTDANTPTTFTAAATVGITWDTAHLFSIGATSPNVGSGFNLNGQISRVAIFPRYLNPTEAALARAQWFTDKYLEQDAPPVWTQTSWRWPTPIVYMDEGDDLGVAAGPNSAFDEDLFLPAPPWPAVKVPQVLVDDGTDGGGDLYGVPLEDYAPATLQPPWPIGTITATTALRPWTSDEQEPAGALFGVPTEDHGEPLSLPPRPTPWAISALALPVWRFDEQEPAGTLFGVPVEEHAAPSTAPPWPSSIWYSRTAVDVWRYDEQEPAGSLFGVPDEDHAFARVFPPWPIGTVHAAGAITAWTADEQLPAGELYGVPSDEPWPAELGPRPRSTWLARPQNADDEIATEPVATLADDDTGWTWFATARPARAPTPFAIEDELPPHPDDDAWAPPSPWRARANAGGVFFDDEALPILIVDDDGLIPPRPWGSFSLASMRAIDDNFALEPGVPTEDFYAPPSPWRAWRTNAPPMVDDDPPAGSLVPTELPLELVVAHGRRWTVIADARALTGIAPTPLNPAPRERVSTTIAAGRIFTLTAEADNMTLKFSPKDPREVITYGISFARLLDDNEGIVDAVTDFEFVEGNASAAEPVAVGDADFTADPVVRQLITGGEAGATHRVMMTATTDAGRVLVASALLPIVTGAVTT